MIQSIVCVCLGGMLGVITRYMIVQRYVEWWGSVINGVLIVNILGAFLMGVVAQYLNGADSNSIRLICIVGFLGSFTTFSTYLFDLIQFVEDRQWMSALGYFLISNVGGISVFLMGYFIAESTR